MNPINLCEAYSAVYDDEIREELLYVEEDLSFIDDLSDNELDQVMESLLVEGVISLNESLFVLDELLTEATVTTAASRVRRSRDSSAKITSSSERPSKVKRTAERQRGLRIGRMLQSAQRAGENVKTKAGGVVSAAAGGAAEAKRKATSTAQKVSGKISSAKEKVKGFLNRTGNALRAGASAAKKEFSGQAAREAQARTTGRRMRRAARTGASTIRAKDTSAFTKEPKEIGQNVKLAATKAIYGTPNRPSLPAAGQSGGSDKRGMIMTPTNRNTRNVMKGFRGQTKVTQNESYKTIASYILEDLITEGYAETFEEALGVLESFSDYEVGELAENYLVDETVDLYDVVLEHLLDEGFADTEEAAAVIMANMSEEWRDEILDEELTGERYSRAAKKDGKDASEKKDRTILHRVMRPSQDQTSFGRGNKARRRMGLNPAPHNAGSQYH